MNQAQADQYQRLFVDGAVSDADSSGNFFGTLSGVIEDRFQNLVPVGVSIGVRFEDMF